MYMRIHRSAFKHGVERADIEHALRNALTSMELNPGEDPARVLAIGPDTSGMLLEIISLALDDEMVIHAMRLRATYRSHLLRRRPPK